MYQYTSDQIERFWKKVEKHGLNECWEWTSATASYRDNRPGYGTFFLEYNPETKRPINVYAHRMSYELAHGEIPDGLHVLHHCDNSLCVNPVHLYAGTPSDNARDMYRRGRDNTVKLSASQLIEAFNLYTSKQMTLRELAERYDVTQETVRKALLNHRKSHRFDVLDDLAERWRPTGHHLPNAKLTPDDVRFIREVYKNKSHPQYMTVYQLADKFGVDISLISRVGRSLDGRYREVK